MASCWAISRCSTSTLDDPIEAYEGALAFGADLGARTATTIDFGVPRPDLADRFAAFHALCARYGIAALVEPISMGHVRTPQDGLDLIEASGVDARLIIDCVHLVRTDCTAETVRTIPDARIGYLQFGEVRPRLLQRSSVSRQLRTASIRVRARFLWRTSWPRSRRT